MVDKIIPPRRDEVLSSKGLGTRRFLDYLERTATQVNNSTSLTEGDLASISMLSAQLSAINKRIDSIVNEISLNNQNSKTDKKATALENDFIAPFYKTKYDKLTIKIANIDNAIIGEKLKLALDNDAADPTVQFGDGDTGFYEESDDVLIVSVGGSKFLTFSSGSINLTAGVSYSINGVSVLNSTALGAGVTASSLTSVGTLSSLNVTGGISVTGTQVVSTQGASVADATGGATIDAEARTAINDLLARVRSHGLIA